MLKRIVQWGAAASGALLSYQMSGFISGLPILQALPGSAYFIMVTGAIIFFFVGTWMARELGKLLHKGEKVIKRLPFADILAGVVGMTTGLIVSVLLYPALSQVEGAGVWAPAVAAVVLGYVGFSVGYIKKDELVAMLPKPRLQALEQERVVHKEPKILDTSVIIDGRIADICKTEFVEGVLIIPEFVLEELQHIADSSDLLKRNRGRRGLDILNKIQKELEIEVQIYEGDFEEIAEVDTKLIKLAKLIEGKVVTNDYNLNKVCELQGVSVLNINDLANAVKPVVLPGEEIWVQVIKDGKEHGQGVAYLDDGTMIVVESGGDFIGRTIEVLVTSVLQTSAGRMIFAKPKLLEKAL